MKGKSITCVALVVALSFAGCLSNSDDDDNEDTASKAVKRYLNSVINEDEEAFCSSVAKADGTRYTSSEIDECIDDWRIEEIENPYGERWMFEYDIEDTKYESFIENVSYSPELVRIASVKVSVLECERAGSNDTWECDEWDEIKIYVGKMSGGTWLILESYDEVSESPFAQFMSTVASNGEYYIDVIMVSANYDLEGFSYFLKDASGSTTEFGEIAMQNLSGNIYGIDTSYDAKCGDSDQSACDDDLQERSDAVYSDDGSNYAVWFNDGDRDGKLSSGDKFTVRGSHGSDTNGPAEDDWSLEVKFDNTGDVIGSKRLG